MARCWGRRLRSPATGWLTLESLACNVPIEPLLPAASPPLQLTRLVIRDCTTVVALPAAVTHLTNLRDLEVSGGAGVMALPELALLQLLTRLILSLNKNLAGLGPALSRVASLQQLDLSEPGVGKADHHDDRQKPRGDRRQPAFGGGSAGGHVQQRLELHHQGVGGLAGTDGENAGGGSASGVACCRAVPQGFQALRRGSKIHDSSPAAVRRLGRLQGCLAQAARAGQGFVSHNAGRILSQQPRQQAEQRRRRRRLQHR